MKNYSLKSNGNRWWWASASAGAASAAVIAAIVVLPTTSGAVPADPGGYVAPATPTERPCFIYRVSNTGGWDGFQPTCPLDTDTHEPAPAPPGRPGLDYGS
jgi:hypothetical protein